MRESLEFRRKIDLLVDVIAKKHFGGHLPKDSAWEVTQAVCILCLPDVSPDVLEPFADSLWAAVTRRINAQGDKFTN